MQGSSLSLHRTARPSSRLQDLPSRLPWTQQPHAVPEVHCSMMSQELLLSRAWQLLMHWHRLMLRGRLGVLMRCLERPGIQTMLAEGPLPARQGPSLGPPGAMMTRQAAQCICGRGLCARGVPPTRAMSLWPAFHGSIPVIDGLS